MRGLRTGRSAWTGATLLAGVLALWGARAPAAPASGVSPTRAAAPLAVSAPGSVALSTPAADVSIPSVGVPIPSVGVPIPSVGVPIPSVGVSIPSVGVSVGGTEVSTPSVSVSGPSVSVSGEGASVSGSEVGVSGPTSPGTGSSPPPASPTPPAEAGSGDPPAARRPSGSDDGASDPGASAATSKAASTPSTTGAGSGSRAAAATRSRSLAGTRAAPPAHAPSSKHRRRTQGARSAGAAGSGAGAARGTQRLHSPRSPRAGTPASRSTRPAAGDLLDRIGGGIPLPIPVPDWSKPIILALVLLAMWLGLRSGLSGMRVRRLERQRTSMQRDLDVMQSALVPLVPAQLEGLGVSVAYRPAEGPAAGGDFYDLFVLAPGRVAVILGDVAGHGQQALTQAALTRYTLRAYLQAGLEPRATLALAGGVLVDPTCEHFATVAVAVYDTRNGRLTYSCAGHPPPIVHGLHGYEPLELCASTPIGWTVPTGRRQTTISLPAGALACFFSDGLIEARSGKELLGRERVSELLAALGPRATAQDLLAQVQRAALSTPDDMAACILTPGGPSTYAHIEELEVDARQLHKPATRRFLEACELPPAEIEVALGHAADIVRECGEALLRVEMDPTGASVTTRLPERPRARPDAPANRSLVVA